MASKTLNLTSGQRAQRKLFLTVAEWKEDTTTKRQILGARTEDSSMELNPDIQTTTDILGKTYTDVEKTEPQQSFDPYYIIGGDDLAAYLTTAVLANNIDAYNGTFSIYLIAMFIGDSTDGYYAVCHSGCSIFPTSIGGSTYTSMPIEIHLSNEITEGVVKPGEGETTINDKFVFTAA